MEAEYIALAIGIKEAIAIEIFIIELGLSDLPSQECELWCDNRAAIDFSKNRIEKGRTKYSDAYHIVWEKLDKEMIAICSIVRESDILTKPLRRVAYREATQRLWIGHHERGELKGFVHQIMRHELKRRRRHHSGTVAPYAYHIIFSHSTLFLYT